MKRAFTSDMEQVYVHSDINRFNLPILADIICIVALASMTHQVRRMSPSNGGIRYARKVTKKHHNTLRPATLSPPPHSPATLFFLIVSA